MSQFANDSSGQSSQRQSPRKERQALRALTAKPVDPRARGKKFPNYRVSHKTGPPIRH